MPLDQELITEGSSEGQIFQQVMSIYIKQKEQVEQSVVLTFQLSGSTALQVWIKKTVHQQFTVAGYHVLEPLRASPYARQLVITNTRNQRGIGNTVSLSAVPQKSEIQHALDKII